MYYILISFTCLCFLIVHWTSLIGLFWILLSDGSWNPITLGSVIRILLVSFGGVMFTWFLVFPDSVLVSAHLGKWSCLPDFTSSLQQGKIFSSQFRPRPGSRWAGSVFRQCSWVLCWVRLLPMLWSQGGCCWLGSAVRRGCGLRIQAGPSGGLPDQVELLPVPMVR